MRDIDRDMHDHLRDFGRHDWNVREKLETYDLLWQQIHSVVPNISERLEKLEKDNER